MRYRRLDDKWDYTFGHGLQNYLTDREAVAQAIKSRIKLLYKEWWEDRTDGLPLWEEILGAPGTPEHIDVVDLIFQDRIEGTANVLCINEWKSQFVNRIYTFKCSVSTTFGVVEISSEEE